MSTATLAGLLLIVMPVAFNVAFGMLAARFGYPDILLRPTDEVLSRFEAGGTGLNPDEPQRMTARSNQASAVHGLKCADLVDAMGRLHRHRCHILDLVTPTPGRVLFGSAVTISYFPSCSAALDPERYNLANLFYEAVGEEPAGKVIVLASNGYTEHLDGRGHKAAAAPSERVRRGAHGRPPARLRRACALRLRGLLLR